MSDDRRYALISNLFIQRAGEACGVTVSDEVASILAEECTYRVREMIDVCSHFVRHSSRTKLLCEDLKTTCKLYNISVPYGTQNLNESTCTFIEEAGLFVENEEQLNLTEYSFSSDNVIVKKSSPILVVKQINCSQNQNNKNSKSTVNVSNITQPSKHLLDYYKMAVSVMLGENLELCKEVLKDIQSNSKIYPIVPYFVNFISSVNIVSHDLDKLSKMLQMVKALLYNKYLNCNNYMNPIITAILYCVLEPLTASIYPLNDHWRLRDFGAKLISYIVNNTTQSLANLDLIQSSVANILNDPTRPLCSHYGAVAIILFIGPKAISELLLPNLALYWKSSLCVIEEETNLSNISIQEDAFKVWGAIKNCIMLLTSCQVFSNFNPIYKIYPEIYEIFGSSLAALVPLNELTKNYDKTDLYRRNAIPKHVLFSSSNGSSPKINKQYYFPVFKKKHEKSKIGVQPKQACESIFENYNFKLSKKKSFVIKTNKCIPRQLKKKVKIETCVETSRYRIILKDCSYTGKRRNNFTFPVYINYNNVLNWVL